MAPNVAAAAPNVAAPNAGGTKANNNATTAGAEKHFIVNALFSGSRLAPGRNLPGPLVTVPRGWQGRHFVRLTS